MKTCTRCNVTKPYSAFRFDKRRQQYRPCCLDCDRAYNRAYKAAHPDYYRAYMKRYWQTHRRPRKPSKRAVLAERQRTERRRAAIMRGDCPDYAEDKRRRFAAILAEVGK